MPEILESVSISKMMRKETHDIFVIHGIERLDRVCESIYHLFRLLQFAVLIDVVPWLISTSKQSGWSMLFKDAEIVLRRKSAVNGFQGDRKGPLRPTSPPPPLL